MKTICVLGIIKFKFSFVHHFFYFSNFYYEHWYTSSQAISAANPYINNNPMVTSSFCSYGDSQNASPAARCISTSYNPPQGLPLPLSLPPAMSASSSSPLPIPHASINSLSTTSMSVLQSNSGGGRERTASQEGSPTASKPFSASASFLLPFTRLSRSNSVNKEKDIDNVHTPARLIGTVLTSFFPFLFKCRILKDLFFCSSCSGVVVFRPFFLFLPCSVCLSLCEAE